MMELLTFLSVTCFSEGRQNVYYKHKVILNAIIEWMDVLFTGSVLSSFKLIEIYPLGENSI